MASKVKRQNIPAEDVSPLVNRYNWNVAPHTLCHAATFATRVSPQAAPNNSLGSKPPDRLPQPGDCGPCAPRPRNCCVPHAGHSKRRGRAVASGLSSDSARHEGGLGGDSRRPARPSANAEGVPGANQNVEVGNSDAARPFEILAVSGKTSGGCVRPWLPQFGPPAPRHARLSRA